MTATVAIQSVPSKAVQGAESSNRTAIAENNNETSNVKNEGKSSFKDLYDDAKKLDNRAEGKTTKQDAAGKKSLAEDGNSLPPESKTEAAENENETALNASTNKSDEDSGQEGSTAQSFSDLNLDATAVKETGETENGMSMGMGGPLKDKLILSGIEKQPVDKTKESALSVLTGLNNPEPSKIDTTVEETDAKSGVNDKLLNNLPAIALVPGGDNRSFAHRLSLKKGEDSITKPVGLNEMMGLSPDKLTDEWMMGDMSKALSKVPGADKLSLDAMLGKLETLVDTTAATQKHSAAAPPLSTILNHSSTTSAPALSGASQTTIAETFGKPEWNQSMSKQISWMANQNIRSAEIKLTPANLGTIEVRVDMHDDKLNVSFSSRDAGVRDSVEQAMPKLREMMEDQGLDLGQTDVSGQTFFEQQEERFSQQGYLAKTTNGENSLSGVDSVNVEDVILKQTVTASMTAVDYYI